MNNNFANLELQEDELGGLTSLQRKLRLWWNGLPAWAHSSYWLGILAMLTVLGMLLAFHDVVRGAVQQGELQRLAAATHAEATWRCKVLSSPRERGDCQLQLDAARPGVGMRQVQRTATGEPVD